jgi:hypothetical protein
MHFETIVENWAGTSEELLLFIITKCVVDDDGNVTLARRALHCDGRDTFVPLVEDIMDCNVPSVSDC